MAAAFTKVLITVEVLTPDKLALANQRDFYRERVEIITELWDNSRTQLDDLAHRLAEQALINEELRARVDWYRNIVAGREWTTYDPKVGERVVDKKIGELMRQHRLNSVG